MDKRFIPASWIEADPKEGVTRRIMVRAGTADAAGFV
jgi:hypothetical protein